MRFILIGDSGQRDPEIYREIIREYPNRVAAAYIRAVTAGTSRAAGLTAVARDIAQVGGRMIVAADTTAAARDAAAAGWITEDALREVREEKESQS
jgi:phosphatidate phosphatase APP1